MRIEKENRPGVVAVEAAIILPLVMLLLVMMIDVFRVSMEMANVQNYALCGASYGCIDPGHASNKKGIETAALMAFCSEQPATVESSVSTVANNGTTDQYVTVVVSVPFTWFAPVPYMPDRLTAKRVIIVQPFKTP